MVWRRWSLWSYRSYRNVNTTNAQYATCFDTQEVNCDSLCRHPEDGSAVPKQIGIISWIVLHDLYFVVLYWVHWLVNVMNILHLLILKMLGEEHKSKKHVRMQFSAAQCLVLVPPYQFRIISSLSHFRIQYTFPLVCHNSLRQNTPLLGSRLYWTHPRHSTLNGFL